MGLRLLSQPVPLGGIDDVELFARDALRRGLRMLGVNRLSYDQETELLAFLIERLVDLYERYDPALNSSFQKYAYPILPRRVVDWYRATWVDTRYQPRPLLDEYTEELGRVVDHGTAMDSNDSLTRAMFRRRLDQEDGVAAAC